MGGDLGNFVGIVGLVGLGVALKGWASRDFGQIKVRWPLLTPEEKVALKGEVEWVAHRLTAAIVLLGAATVVLIRWGWAILWE